jgi:hypothetical protein
MEIMTQLSYKLLMVGSLDDFDELCGEMEKLESEFSDAENLVSKFGRHIRENILEQSETSSEGSGTRRSKPTVSKPVAPKLSGLNGAISSTPVSRIDQSQQSATAQWLDNQQSADYKDQSDPLPRKTARKHQACFRCLGYKHQGNKCTRSRTCGIENCRSSHHCMTENHGLL